MKILTNLYYDGITHSQQLFQLMKLVNFVVSKVITSDFGRDGYFNLVVVKLVHITYSSFNPYSRMGKLNTISGLPEFPE